MVVSFWIWIVGPEVSEGYISVLEEILDVNDGCTNGAF